MGPAPAASLPRCGPRPPSTPRLGRSRPWRHGPIRGMQNRACASRCAYGGRNARRDPLAGRRAAGPAPWSSSYLAGMVDERCELSAERRGVRGTQIDLLRNRYGAGRVQLADLVGRWTRCDGFGSAPVSLRCSWSAGCAGSARYAPVERPVTGRPQLQGVLRDAGRQPNWRHLSGVCGGSLSVGRGDAPRAGAPCTPILLVPVTASSSRARQAALRAQPQALLVLRAFRKCPQHQLSTDIS